MKKALRYLPIITSWLLALLFLYAAVSKMLDFENFQVQLAQSPLLSAYAGFVSYFILAIEFVVVFLLFLPRTARFGLYASLGLMAAFTAYIYLILNFGDFIPCSCGGILEKMSWGQHLIFNICFVVMTTIAIFLSEGVHRRVWRSAAYCSIVIMVSCMAVFVLFLSSEHIIKKENNFTRRFLFHPLEEKVLRIDLGFNSYYFAGTGGGKIYLGNVTAPDILTIVDTALLDKKEMKIIPDRKDHPFKSIQVRIKAPHYYLYDGTVPIIYRGKLGDPHAKTVSLNDAYFNQLAVIDSTKFAIRTIDSKTRAYTLGLLDLSTKEKVKLSTDLLEKQTDGVFDSDGRLIQDVRNGELAYTYFYRNRFIILDSALNPIQKLNTIDTTTRAQVAPVALSDGRHKMAAPPLVVNKNTVIADHILLNESGLRGKFEDRKAWARSSIIDCYRTDRQHYIGSLYISHDNGKAVSSMLVEGKYLYVMSGSTIRRFTIRDGAFK